MKITVEVDGGTTVGDLVKSVAKKLVYDERILRYFFVFLFFVFCLCLLFYFVYCLHPPFSLHVISRGTNGGGSKNVREADWGENLMLLLVDPNVVQVFLFFSFFFPPLSSFFFFLFISLPSPRFEKVGLLWRVLILSVGHPQLKKSHT